MSKRVTIVIDEEIDTKLRTLQCQLMIKDKKSYSFSQVLNDTLKKVLK